MQCNIALAQPLISNLIYPVDYFSGRNEELKKISIDLNKHTKASITGFSGIGKSQVIRMYALRNQKQYKIIWFFDCNTNLDRQFAQLVHEINSNQNTKFFLKDISAKQTILNYIKSKKNILLVFDNLKIGQNKVIKEFIDAEHNSHILFSSQDSQNLPHITNIKNLSYSDSKEILDKILSDRSENEKNILNAHLSGYPILITQASYLLNDNKYLTIEDYKKILNNNKDIIEEHIFHILQNLSKSSKDLLYKMILLSDTLSKDVINRIQSTDIEELQELIRFNLIKGIKLSNNVQIFEIHDIIKNTLLKNLNNNDANIIIKSIIISINKSLPTSSLDRYELFILDNTLLNAIEQLEQNALKYKIHFSKILILTRQRLLFSIFARDILTANEIQARFQNSIDPKYYNSFKQNTLEQVSYSECIFFLGLNNWLLKGNKELGYQQLIQAKKIVETVLGEEMLKISIYGQLAQYQSAFGNLNAAQENLNKIGVIKNQFPNEDLGYGLYHLVLSKVLLDKGQYEKALEEIECSIGIVNKNKLSNDVFIVPYYLLMAKIHNRMKNYQIAKEICLRIYTQKNLKDKYDFIARALVELSNAELGLGKDKKRALNYAKKAKEIFILYKNDNKNLRQSSDFYLANALVSEANAMFNNGKNAIEEYLVAENIFYNNYKSNMKNIDDLSCLYYYAAINCKRMGNEFWFKKFRDQHFKYFGMTHRRSMELDSIS